MLWTIAVILMVLWALGLVTSYTMGGFIHILIVVAVIVVLIRVIQGRNVFAVRRAQRREADHQPAPPGRAAVAAAAGRRPAAAPGAADEGQEVTLRG